MYQTDVCQVCLLCLMPCSAALGKHSWARKWVDPDPDRKGIQMKRFGSKSAIAFRMCAWARHCPAMSLRVLVQWHRKTNAMDKSNSLSGCFFRTLGNPRPLDNTTRVHVSSLMCYQTIGFTSPPRLRVTKHIACAGLSACEPQTSDFT